MSLNFRPNVVGLWNLQTSSSGEYEVGRNGIKRDLGIKSASM